MKQYSHLHFSRTIGLRIGVACFFTFSYRLRGNAPPAALYMLQGRAARLQLNMYDRRTIQKRTHPHLAHKSYQGGDGGRHRHRPCRCSLAQYDLKMGQLLSCTTPFINRQGEIYAYKKGTLTVETIYFMV